MTYSPYPPPHESFFKDVFFTLGMKYAILKYEQEKRVQKVNIYVYIVMCAKELLISIFVIELAYFYLTYKIAFALRLSTSFRFE
jgi:hypothetical protein